MGCCADYLKVVINSCSQFLNKNWMGDGATSRWRMQERPLRGSVHASCNCALGALNARNTDLGKYGVPKRAAQRTTMEDTWAVTADLQKCGNTGLGRFMYSSSLGFGVGGQSYSNFLTSTGERLPFHDFVLNVQTTIPKDPSI